MVDEVIVLAGSLRLRFSRVVYEIDISTPGSSSRSRRASVVLPAPDGDDNTSINPLRAESIPPHSMFCTCSRN